MHIITDILIIIGILGFAFVTVAAEIALLQSKLNDVQAGSYVHKMVDNKSEFLSTIQVGITLSSMLAGAFGEPAMTDLLSFLPIPEHTLFIVSFILITYISIVLTELLPKNVAMAFTKETLDNVALPIKIIHLTFYPMVWLLDRSSKGLSHLLQVPIVNEQDDILTQEQLIQTVFTSAHSNESDLSKTDLASVQQVVKLDEKRVKDYQSTNSSNDSYPTIDGDKNLYEALTMMAEQNVDTLQVIKNDHITGTITTMDIIKECH